MGVTLGIGFAIVVTGVLAAGATALLGTVLVARGQAMLTDAISHGIVLGIAVTFLITGEVSGPVQLLGAGLTGFLTVSVTEALAASRKLKRDAATALVFPAFFATGVLLLSLFARDTHVDAHTVLLGEIGFVWLDTVSVLGAELPRAAVTLAAVFAVNLAFVTLLRKQIVAAAFDPVLAATQGLMPRLTTGLLLALTSVTAVAALDAVGVVLFVAFAIVPAVTGRALSGTFAGMQVSAVLLAMGSAVAGYYVALWADVSIGATMASLTGVPLLASLVWLAWRRRRSAPGAQREAVAAPTAPRQMS